MTVLIAALIDYALPCCRGTFNQEGNIDGLTFVTSVHDINIDRLKNNTKSV